MSQESEIRPWLWALTISSGDKTSLGEVPGIANLTHDFTAAEKGQEGGRRRLSNTVPSREHQNAGRRHSLPAGRPLPSPAFAWSPSWEQIPDSHWEAVDGRPGNRGHGSPWGPGHPQGLSHPCLCHLCPCTGEPCDTEITASVLGSQPRPLGRLAAPCVPASVHLCLLDSGGAGHPRQTSLGLVSGGQPFTTSYRDQGWKRSFHQKRTE